ncbi:MAG: glycosyltransferase [Jatrophihabitans sp.]|uniref:glycosyltransferase n=1 Tax=Jatrophihabitans sp. TaxID=1932789 RepID=UPI003F80A48E
MRVLLWHVHGSYTTSLVHGRHDYLLPVLPDRGPDGRGRAQTWDWPATAVEVTPEQLADEAVDVVIVQRPHELDLVREWTGRRPGLDVPTVYLEHNAPEPHPVTSRHPLADHCPVDGIPLVHVTHFNRLFWDNGGLRTHVIEHSVVDPGDRYTGELPHAAVVVNEPVRRDRMVGTDLLGELAKAAPIDLFGMGDGPIPGTNQLGDVPQDRMHTELARRRAYLHPVRWTSLGLSLIEAMHLAMPVVAVASTEVPRAVPPEAGVVSADPDELAAALRTFVADPDAARAAGQAARAHALQHYGLDRFLADWDRVIEEVAR